MIWIAFGIFCAFFGIFYFIAILYASIQAYKGNFYHYPTPFTFIKMKNK
jgi:uncharacterized Tic20 family protein